jgi:outer membrane protein, multidrug efflux system
VTHAIGPSLTMPLFSGGAIRENIQAQDERAKQALIEYESSVLTALHEVDGAATSIGWLAARLDATDRALAQAGLSLSRSETLYQEGLTTIDAVLDARRNLFGLQDTRAQIQSSLSRSYVDLFRALGGGWPVEDAPLPPKGEI